MIIGYSHDYPDGNAGAGGTLRVYANRAFIQLAGFTFGKATSFFDFFSSAAATYVRGSVVERTPATAARWWLPTPPSSATACRRTIVDRRAAPSDRDDTTASTRPSRRLPCHRSGRRRSPTADQRKVVMPGHRRPTSASTRLGALPRSWARP